MTLNNTTPGVRRDAAETQERTNSTYVETVRDGAVGAGIFHGTNKHYFVLSRAWKSTESNKSGHSQGFYPGNAEALASVITKAAERCRELDGNSSGKSAN